jgi:hypothetical protein
MFRIVFSIIIALSILFTLYNPGLPGLLLLMVEAFFVLVSSVLYLNLKKKIRISLGEEYQGFTVRVENHSDIPAGRIFLTGTVKENWTGKISNIKLLLQTDAQSEEIFEVTANRLSDKDDVYDGLAYPESPGIRQKLDIAVNPGSNDLTIDKIDFYDPLGLFKKTIPIHKTITLYQFPEWVNIPFRGEWTMQADPDDDVTNMYDIRVDDSGRLSQRSLDDHEGCLLLKVDLGNDTGASFSGKDLEIFLGALLSVGLAATSRDRRVHVAIPGQALFPVSNEEEMYSALRTVMDLKPGKGVSGSGDYDLVVTVTLKPSVIFKGKEIRLSSKNWKKEIMELADL